MKNFRLILSFFVCGWLVFVLDGIQFISGRLSNDFARIALWVAGVEQ